MVIFVFCVKKTVFSLPREARIHCSPERSACSVEMRDEWVVRGCSNAHDFRLPGNT